MPPDTIADTETLQLVIFTLGSEQYALPIERVQEIIRYTEPRSVTSSDPSILGVISLRGKIIQVYDLSSRLGRHALAQGEGNIIVVDTDEEPVGVVVDGVNEVTTIQRSQIEPLPTATGDLIGGIAKLGDRLVVLINPEHAIHA